MGRRHSAFSERMREFLGCNGRSVLSLCNCSGVMSALRTLALILIYYCFSISLTFYNQRFIHKYKFPLSITMVHLVTKFLISGLLRTCLSCWTGKERVTLSWKSYFLRISPPGITSSLDIALSNWSFEFITVSLYTMTKSTVIVFILGFSILFKLEKLKCSLIFVVLFIAAGLFMFTFQSTQFNLTGFLMVLSASFLSGLRWTLSQLVLQKSDLGLQNPLDMMYHIQPWMILTLLPLSACFEGLYIPCSDVGFSQQCISSVSHRLLLAVIGALLAFMMEITEFVLLLVTSSLTLSISGIMKEICTLYLAIRLNDDSMTWLNAVGLGLCMIGISIHVTLKAVSANNTTVKGHTVRRGESVELLLANDDSDGEDEVFNHHRDR